MRKKYKNEDLGGKKEKGINASKTGRRKNDKRGRKKWKEQNITLRPTPNTVIPFYLQ